MQGIGPRKHVFYQSVLHEVANQVAISARFIWLS